MLTRALVVLLLILNLGVALWWATRAPPVPAPELALPPGAEPLRLLDEPAPAAAAPAPTAVPGTAEPAAGDGAPAVAVVATPAPTAAPAEEGQAPVCIAFGPFADAAAAEAAHARLQPAVQQMAMRESRVAPRGWRVVLPAQADRAAADAAAARLTEAGFRDHYIMSAAEDGRMDIALGRFGSESAAQRHRSALREAGFEAVAEPIGDAGDVRHWIDARVDTDADIAALRRTAGAIRADAVDCGALATAAR